MAILRAVRFGCGMLQMGILIVGVAALLRGEWAYSIAAVIGFFIIGSVFLYAQSGVERLERSTAAELIGRAEHLVVIGDWENALKSSTRATNLLAKSVRGAGSASELKGPLAAVLVAHSVLLGANGDIVGAHFASSRAVRILTKVADPTPLAWELLDTASRIQDGVRSRHGDDLDAMQFCRQMARQVLNPM